MACLALLGIGCGNKEVIEIDHRFSNNVVKTPAWFPGEKTVLSAGEQEVIFRRGNPDFIRFWWNSEGSIVDTSDFSGKSREDLDESMGTVKKSWIYMFDKKEIMFTNSREGYRERDLEESLELICQHGDPGTRSKIVSRGGHEYQTWSWLENGLQVELMDNKVIKKNYLHTGTGMGTDVGK